MSRAAREEAGRRGERLAVRFLRKQGCKVLRRNCRTRFGEIDIIARDGDEVVFVEVKTRSLRSWGAPESAVTPAKQRKIVRVAEQYLVERGLEDRPCRFDVVAVTPGAGGTDEVVRGAFML